MQNFEESLFEKMKLATDSEKYLVFWITADGSILYRIQGLNSSQITYVSKTVEILTENFLRKEMTQTEINFNDNSKMNSNQIKGN